jgi:membrane protein DedA with SNARE-associated domain
LYVEGQPENYASNNLELASIIDIPPNLGYIGVFLFITVETMGVPVPGETAYIAACIMAAAGKIDIALVIAIAAAAAIIGDNIGFAIGRKVGRKVFEAPGPMYKTRLLALQKGEPFFARHGPKAVFLGRWVALLRIASSWLAGMNGMRWPTFLFWNALGGICWAVSIGLAAYFAGEAAKKAIHTVGIGAAVLVGLAAIALVIWKIVRHRKTHNAELKAETDAEAEPLASSRPNASSEAPTQTS